MKRKTVYIDDEIAEQLERLKNDYGFKTESQLISWLIRREAVGYDKVIATAVCEELDKNYVSKERLRWATKVAEQNTIVILDILNTMLHHGELEDCIYAEVIPAKVVQQSQNRIKEKIKYFKQKSDDRKQRKGD